MTKIRNLAHLSNLKVKISIPVGSYHRIAETSYVAEQSFLLWIEVNQVFEPHAQQTQTVQADWIFFQQQAAEAVTQGLLVFAGMPMDVAVEKLPGGQLLLLTELAETIEVGLPGRFLDQIGCILRVKPVDGGALVRAVPVERLVHAGDTFSQLGIDAQPPVVEDVPVPFRKDLPDEVTGQQHTVSGGTVVKQQVFQVVAGNDHFFHLPFLVNGIGMIAGNAEVVCADGGYLFGNFFRVPDIVLVGNGDEISGCLFQCILKVAVEAEVLRMLFNSDKRILRGIFPGDVQRMVGRPVVLNNQFVDGISLADDAVQLCFQEAFAVVGAEYDGYSFHLAFLFEQVVQAFFEGDGTAEPDNERIQYSGREDFQGHQPIDVFDGTGQEIDTSHDQGSDEAERTDIFHGMEEAEPDFPPHEIVPYQQPPHVDGDIYQNHAVDAIRVEQVHHHELAGALCDGIPHEEVGFSLADEQVGV